METKELKPAGAYAWLLVLALGLMSAGTTGSYSVVAGGFMTPVCEGLGIDFTAFSYYFTGTLLGLAFALPLAGKLMPKVIGNYRIVAIACVLLLAGASMSFFTEAWQFWIASLVIGVGFSFTTGVAMSSVIDQWFVKKAGLAIGLAWAVNSVYMLIMSPVMISVIEAIGWRNGYLVLAAVSAVMVLPGLIFVIRYRPADKGMLPYGYDANEATGTSAPATELADAGVPFKVAVKSPSFIACVLFLCLVQLTVCMNQLFPTFAVEVGFDPIIGGYMVSAASFADIFLNIFVGSTCDRFGSAKAIVAWVCVSIISFVMLIFCVGNPTLAIVAAGVNDVMYVIAGAALTCLVMEIFGSKDFGRIFAWVCAIGYIVGAFGMPVMTGVYEATGTFQSVFILCIVLNVCIALLAVAAKASSKNLKWEGSQTDPVSD